MTKWQTVALVALMGAFMAFGLAATAAASPNLTMSIPKIEAPTIDGQLNDAGWVTASTMGGKFVSDINYLADAIIAYPRVAYAGYDDEAMYFGVVVYAPDVTKLVDDATNLWGDDEVELIIQPTPDSAVAHYFVSPKGEHNEDSLVVATTREGMKLVVEIAVPFSTLGVSAPASGDQWGLHIAGHQTDPDMYMSYSQSTRFVDPAQLGVAVFQ